MNVTAPFKLDAHDFADDLSVRAQPQAPSIRCPSGPRAKVFGDNTDGAGLVQDITVNLDTPLPAPNPAAVQAALRGV